MFLFHSMRDLHEHLTYFSKPEDKNAISKIQLYLNYYITYCKLINALDDTESGPVFTLKINLDINGMSYTENSEGVVDAINQLAQTDGFEIDIRYFGEIGDISTKLGDGTLFYSDVVGNYYGMYEYLENSTDRNLEYKMMAYYGNYDEFAIKYIDADGCVNNYTEESGMVEESDNGHCLSVTNNFSILANFDFEKYSTQAESLKRVISDYIQDKEDLDLLEELWAEGEFVGVTDLSIGCLNLDNFIYSIERINYVLSEIDDETLYVKTEGVLYNLEKFIVANPFYNEEENTIKVSLVSL